MTTKNLLSMYSKTILVVDDMPFFLKMAEDCFRREQVDIITARSGKEALEIVDSKKPDLVLLDLYMPGGDGDEVCLKIKGDYRSKSTPIIMMTSSGNQKDIERCRNAGCDDLLHKPLSRDDLLRICRKFVRFPRWSGERLPVDVPVTYGKESNAEFSGALSDISVGGIFLETDELLQIDSEVHLKFQLSSDVSPIQCMGKVTWINRELSSKKSYASGMGIKFTKIRKIEILAIQAWMERTGMVNSAG